MGGTGWGKRVRDYGMEEHAARVRAINPTGGVLFARKDDSEGTEKAKARQLVIDLFSFDRCPGFVHLVTMPGAMWRFEYQLLALRAPPENAGTYFTCCENDRSIFFAAVAKMPRTPRTVFTPIKRKTNTDFMEMGLKTKVASLFFANIDDLMTYPDWDDGWTGAWLDYTGPLTLQRIALIEAFYRKWIQKTLVITALNARGDKETNAAIRQAGSMIDLLRRRLDGAILHAIHYCDTSPMLQLAVEKR